MKVETKSHLNTSHGNTPLLSRKLKAVIGYWTDYFCNKYEGKVTFNVCGEKITVKDKGENYYTISVKWIQFDIHYLYIFETLDLLESLLKGVHNNVEEP